MSSKTNLSQSELNEKYKEFSGILAPYKIDVILKRFSNAVFSLEDVWDGQAGVAKHLAPCLINPDGKKMIKLVDRSKQIYITVDEFGNFSEDIMLLKLATSIQPIALDKATMVYEELKSNLVR